MTKRQEANRVALTAELNAQGHMTVGDLIMLLKTYPQNARVTGYNGQECTDFVTPEGVRLEDDEEGYRGLYEKNGCVFTGQTVDIMGF